MRLFIRKVLTRLVLLVALLLLVFLVEWPSSYYYAVPEGTDFSKLPWIGRKMDASTPWDSTVIFVGSSICFNGINDSLLCLLCEWDNNPEGYLNLGVTHSCYAIVDVLLEQLIEERHYRPKKVILGLKPDAMPRNIHNMFPLIATSGEIIQSGADGNMLVIPSVLKKAAWNTHFITRHFKYTERDPLEVITSFYGYKPQPYIDSAEVEKNYRRLKDQAEINFNAIENDLKGGKQSLKLKLLLTKFDYVDNIRYQRKAFARSAALLDRHNIPYDILLYPNLVLARSGKQDVMANYFRRTFSDIDFSRHEIIVVRDTLFTDARYWVDMNHLNPDGADSLTRYVFEYLKEH
jgi:hypothetical protein